MTRQEFRGSARVATVAALLMGGMLTACESDLFEPQWSSNIGTVHLFSLARPELNLPSAFGFNERLTRRVEAPASSGSWDIALDTRDGQLVFMPPGALGIPSLARIGRRPGVAFDEVTEAPTDTAEYSGAEPVLAEEGAVYVVRTGQNTDFFGGQCVYFAKMEVEEVDPEVATVRFRYEANPVCNDPGLVPTEN